MDENRVTEIVKSKIEQQIKICRERIQEFLEKSQEVGPRYAVKYYSNDAVISDYKLNELSGLSFVSSESASDYYSSNLEKLAAILRSKIDQYTRDIMEHQCWRPNSTCPATNFVSLNEASAKAELLELFEDLLADFNRVV